MKITTCKTTLILHGHQNIVITSKLSLNFNIFFSPYKKKLHVILVPAKTKFV